MDETRTAHVADALTRIGETDDYDGAAELAAKLLDYSEVRSAASLYDAYDMDIGELIGVVRTALQRHKETTEAQIISVHTNGDAHGAYAHFYDIPDAPATVVGSSLSERQVDYIRRTIDNGGIVMAVLRIVAGYAYITGIKTS